MNTEHVRAVELPQERRRVILERLEQQGKVLAGELAQDLGVSEDTIRRDLRVLHQQGLLLRVHGGALPASPVEASFHAREKSGREGAVGIATAAASLVRDGQVVFFDSGTTVLEIVRRLPRDIRITAVTLSPKTALALAERPHVEILFPGGRLNTQAMAVTGAQTLKELEAIQADVCFLGVCSVHPETGARCSDFDEAPLKRAMVRNAAEVVAPVLAEKLGAGAAYAIAEADELTHLITQKSASDVLLKEFRALSIEVLTI